MASMSFGDRFDPGLDLKVQVDRVQHFSRPKTGLQKANPALVELIGIFFKNFDLSRVGHNFSLLLVTAA